MREILFRGKRVDTGEWVYGYYCPCVFGNFPAEPAIIDADELKKGKWAPVKVTPESVGQYTGENDKDGAKIFEGDIVTVGDHIDFVQYERGCFCMDNQWIFYEFTYQDFSQIKVIGNKWDNPELLKDCAETTE